jgi:hypothetical protein
MITNENKIRRLFNLRMIEMLGAATVPLGLPSPA